MYNFRLLKNHYVIFPGFIIHIYYKLFIPPGHVCFNLCYVNQVNLLRIFKIVASSVVSNLMCFYQQIGSDSWKAGLSSESWHEVHTHRHKTLPNGTTDHCHRQEGGQHSRHTERLFGPKARLSSDTLSGGDRMIGIVEHHWKPMAPIGWALTTTVAFWNINSTSTLAVITRLGPHFW